MRKFETIEAAPLVLLEPDIDTDVIFPARFLVVQGKVGLGRFAFHERRFGQDGMPHAGFPPFDQSRPILLVGRNFGCGSSREQAVWALADLGIRCIIAPSFGEIFFSNCLKSGVLPVQLHEEYHHKLIECAENAPIKVDLGASTVACRDLAFEFKVPPHSRRILLLGLDEIDLVLKEDAGAIVEYEVEAARRAPWLFSKEAAEHPALWVVDDD